MTHETQLEGLVLGILEMDLLQFNLSLMCLPAEPGSETRELDYYCKLLVLLTLSVSSYIQDATKNSVCGGLFCNTGGIAIL